ncbi:Dihydroneopterin aldolase family protein [Sphingomonas sp. EC-HK361]|uniref:dihydroneopterin aldolase n=1 Tax=Sphingomonas sp. EC-HK361 TaxID=2038397 RepID=UPI001258B286|nr:dihydroneopterin aldolase [Sphingomonas sp. EC-HK361]VVT13443.1 Dihydroneopterin aldolase family protein [Sphingomonas sp. EC-HK361]
MAEFTTLIEDMELRLHLGIHPHEAAPQRVLVSVWMTAALVDPIADEIEAAVDYDRVVDAIRALARGEGFALQESLCEAIAAIAFADVRVTRVRVRTTKPDIFADARVGCEIERSR